MVKIIRFGDHIMYTCVYYACPIFENTQPTYNFNFHTTEVYNFQ